jgi:hypothetical protein
LEAAIAADIKAIELGLDSSKLNFPDRYAQHCCPLTTG